MSGTLYNPAVEQRVVILYINNGKTYSTAIRKRFRDDAHSVSECCELVFLDELLGDGWQVVSVTPIHERSAVMILERRIRD